MALNSIRDGDNRYKVIGGDGRLVGFVHKWYRQEVGSAIPRFRATPIGQPERDSCESLSSALKYLEAFE